LGPDLVEHAPVVGEGCAGAITSGTVGGDRLLEVAGRHVVEVRQPGEPGLQRAARVVAAADHGDADRVLRDELPALELEPAVVLVADRVAGEVVAESRT